jgi:Zn-dependent protease
MAAIEREVPRPLGAFCVAVAGPLLSLGLFVFFSVARAWAVPESMLASTLTSLAAINLTIALFNLLPGLPLDGGKCSRRPSGVGQGIGKRVCCGRPEPARGWAGVWWG